MIIDIPYKGLIYIWTNNAVGQGAELRRKGNPLRIMTSSSKTSAVVALADYALFSLSHNNAAVRQSYGVTLRTLHYTAFRQVLTSQFALGAELGHSSNRVRTIRQALCTNGGVFSSCRPTAQHTVVPAKPLLE